MGQLGTPIGRKFAGRPVSTGKPGRAVIASPRTAAPPRAQFALPAPRAVIASPRTAAPPRAQIVPWSPPGRALELGPSKSSPFGRPSSGSRGAAASGGESPTAALSKSATADTQTLRLVAQAAGASPEVVSGSRSTLVRALGAEATAAAGGQSLSAVVERMRSMGVEASDVARSKLFYPDPQLLRDPRDLYAAPRRRFDRLPFYMLAGIDLASAEDNGSGSAKAPPFSGMPGAVPYRAGNWSEDFSEYTIAEGDNFCGLGKTYGKGLCAKGVEIFSYQPDKFQHCMDPASCTAGRKLYAPGDVLQMPPWAQEQARAYAAADVPSAPSTPGAPGYGNQAPGKPDKPGGKKPGGGGWGGKADPKSFFEKHKVPIMLGGAVAVVGAIVLFA